AKRAVAQAMLRAALAMPFRVRLRAFAVPPSSVVRIALATLLAAVAVLVGRPAAAQVATGGATITVLNEQTIVRLDSKGNQTAKRPITLNPEAVNLQDCVDDQQIQFTLQVTGIQQNASLQVWASNAGNDCTDVTSRSTGVQQCWKLGGDLPLNT